MSTENMEQEPTVEQINAQIDAYVNNNLDKDPQLKHAWEETKPWRESEDEMSHWMATHAMRMIAVFSMEGHSGFSGSVANKTVSRLIDFKPLSACNDTPEEWNEIEDGHFQHRRCSKIFKRNGVCSYIDFFVFMEPSEDGDWIPFGSRESSVKIEMPFMPPDEPVFIYLKHEDEDREAAIRRHGYDPVTGGKLNTNN